MKTTNFAIEVNGAVPLADSYSYNVRSLGYNAYVYAYNKSNDCIYLDLTYHINTGLELIITYKDTITGRDETIIRRIDYPLGEKIPVVCGAGTGISATWCYGGYEGGGGTSVGFYESNGYLYYEWAWTPDGYPFGMSPYEYISDGYKVYYRSIPILRLANARKLGISKLPNKTSYKNDESIDYSGVKIVYGAW